jgi:hypothetical protein
MKKTIRFVLNVVILISALFCAIDAAAFAQKTEPVMRITTASGVRVRTAPQTTADEVVRLPIGTVFTELERSDKKENIGGVETYWYRLKTADGKEGWLFGGLTALVNAGGLEVSYLNIAIVRLKIENATYADLMDLTEFLARVSPQITNANRKAELDLYHLLAMQKMLNTIPPASSDQPQYSKWTKTHENEVIYSEPCGCWMVRNDLYWDLYKKSAKLPIAEEIAWAGANASVPGECEGFLECEMTVFNITYGKYMELYPHGRYLEEAADHLSETLKWATENMKHPKGIQPEDRASLQKQLGTVRATIFKTTLARKQSILDAIDQLAKHYK